MEPFGFVFSGEKLTKEVLPDGEQAPHFRSLKTNNVSGTVHACTLKLKSVVRRTLGVDASGMLLWIQQTVGPDCTAVVFVPRESKALVKRAADDVDECQVVLFATQKSQQVFDFSQLDTMLDRFHQEWTSSHMAYCRVWKTASKRILKEYAEVQIQGNLLAYLRWFVQPQGLVDEEIVTRKGRTDIRIVRLNQRKDVESAILELKVLSHKRDARLWALEGLQQVQDYRSTIGGSGEDYLCCFDARTTDQDIPDVVTACNGAGVNHKRFYM